MRMSGKRTERSFFVWFQNYRLAKREEIFYNISKVRRFIPVTEEGMRNGRER